MKRFFIAFFLFTLIFYPLSSLEIPEARAASKGSVVINEIAWMGSQDSFRDEWIELYNTTGTDIDLTGWIIDDDYGTQTYQLSGTIPANGYFLIENSEDSTSVPADLILNLSLGNSGDSLILIDQNGQVIDSVNSSGGAWFAGNTSEYASMERIDPNADGDDASNWADNTAGNGAIGSQGSLLNSTPGSQNSVYSTASGDTSVSFESPDVNPIEGDSFVIEVYAENVTNLLSYGFDIFYDPEIIKYVSAQKSGFLSEDGTVTTAFYEGLENDLAGKIVVGESRLTSPASGISGSGILFELNFNALQAGSTQLTFDSASFLSDADGIDIPAVYNPADITIEAHSIGPVNNLVVSEGQNRYELDLSWESPASDADYYQILKKQTNGVFAEISTTTEAFFTDADNLVPNHTYQYQVVAIKGSLQSPAVSAEGIETRGIKGDNTRSDRVDGRDLDNLARHFALTEPEANFNKLIDTNYDGIIDGSDLIDIGANWALIY